MRKLGVITEIFVLSLQRQKEQKRERIPLGSP